MDQSDENQSDPGAPSLSDAEPADSSAHAETLPAQSSGASVPPTQRLAAPSGTSDESLPARIGKYVIVARLDAGGQGEVYRALHPTLASEVVVKVFHSTDDVRRTAVDEGRVLASLAHPNIARVFDSDQSADCRHFLVMEFVRGRNFRQYSDGKPMAPADAARLVARAARGLGAAHRAGVVHLDVKPPNLLVSEAGEVKVIDFGVARLRGAWREDRLEGVSGTILYFAPEQAKGLVAPDMVGELTPRTDVFALGLVLFYLLTGKDAYAGGDWHQVASRAAAADFDRTALDGLKLARRLKEICFKALSVDPANRYADGDAMADALESVKQFKRGCSMQFSIAISLVVAAVAATVFFVDWSFNAGPVMSLQMPSSQPMSQVEVKLAEAKRLFAAGRYAEAGTIARIILRTEPMHPEAVQFLRMMESHLDGWMADAARRVEAKDFVGALKIYQDILSVDPGRSDALAAWNKTGPIVDAERRLIEAERLIGEAEQLALTDPKGAREKAREAERLFPRELASNDMRVRFEKLLLSNIRVLNEPPSQKTKDALIAEAEQEERRGNWGIAANRLSAVLKLEPANAIALAGIARIRASIDNQLQEVEKKEKAGSADEAIALIEDLRKHDPQNPAILNARQRVYSRVAAGRLKLAEESLADCRPADALALLEGATDNDSVKKAAEIRLLMANACAVFLSGQKAREAQDFRTAAVAFEHAARGGQVAAMVQLGDLYRRGGSGLTADAPQAVNWYRRAAVRGEVSAMLPLASLLDTSSPNEAAKWVAVAAQNGDVAAMLDLASRYRKGGRGVERNDGLAADWYRTAAVQKGNPEAMCRLGEMYAEGAGVPKDLAEARQYFTAAKRLGSAEAAIWLSKLKNGAPDPHNREDAKPAIPRRDNNGL